MTEFSYTMYERNKEDNMPVGSTLDTRFPATGYKGNRINDNLAALASALRSLGDDSVKYQLDENGNPILGSNGDGRIRSMAFESIDNATIVGAWLGPNVRGSLPIRTLITWLGTWDNLREVYHVDLKTRGWVVCDGRTEVSPYPPFTPVTVPNLLGRYAYFYDDAATLGTGQFQHIKSTDTQGVHDHGGSAGGTALTGTYVPALSRTGVLVDKTTGVTNVTDSYSYGGAGAAHIHPIAAAAGHAHAVDVRPASIVCVPLLRCW